MVALVALTGALHQDGLADTADGLGVRGDRARRLEVMHDSSTGAFGVLALIAWALLLYTALEPLSAARALRTLIVAGAAGRLAAVLHGFGAPPARAGGLGGATLTVPPATAVAATVIAAAVAVAAAGPATGGAAIGAAAVLAASMAAFARRALGGRTGDTLGATVALTDVAVCLTLLAIWR
jgi:adenosylcobinamide-GDP ribazoletransferase